MNTRALAALMATLAIVTLPVSNAYSQPLGTQVATAPQFFIQKDHQDMHLQVLDHTPYVKLRDDGSASSAGSAYRPTDTVVIAVPDHAQISASRLASEIGVQTSGPIFNLPEVQDPDLPWLGFSTQGVQASDLASGNAITISFHKVDGPDQGRVILWKQTSLSSDAKILLDSDTPTDSWAFPLDTHQHTGMAFTQPGRYTITFRFIASYSGNSCAQFVPVDYTLTFLVGDAAIAQAPTGLRDQSVVNAAETDFTSGLTAPTECLNYQAATVQAGTATSDVQVVDQALKGLLGPLQGLHKAVDNIVSTPVPAPATVAPGTAAVAEPTPASVLGGGGVAAAAPAPVLGGGGVAAAPVLGGSGVAAAPVASVAPAPTAPVAGGAMPDPVPTTYVVQRPPLGVREGFAFGIGLMSLLMGIAAFIVARKLRSTGV